ERSTMRSPPCARSSRHTRATITRITPSTGSARRTTPRRSFRTRLASYAQKDFQHALVEFRATIETYPRGNKVPDALLKVGYCYQSLGQADKAKAVLEQVVNLYPKTEP